jgi:purine-binding chemotaxis protein CheW
MERVKNKHKNVFLSFRLKKELFAVSVKKVLEVLQQQHITEIPDLPEYIKGVINFRGDILPIFDARLKLNLTIPSEEEQQNVIIVLDLLYEDKNIRIGAIVDEVKDVLSFDENDIKPVPEMGLKYNMEYINGIIKVGDNFIMILNVDKVFTYDDVHILNTITNEQ